MNIDISVVFRIDPENVTSLHLTLREDYARSFVRPATREVGRDIVSRYTAEALYADGGESLATEMQNTLEPRFASIGLILEGVTVTNLEFSDSFTEAIERRGQAETEVYNVQQTAEAIRLTAQADADAARATAEALQRTPTPRP